MFVYLHVKLKQLQMEKPMWSEEEKRQKPDVKISKSATPLLDAFGRDLVKLASEGKLDDVFGRDKEIDDIIHILNKRKKNNPMLVGGAGVGKTAVVEGLAIKIFNKKVDVWLLNKRIIEVNITSVISGTKYRGEFEERMEDLMKEVESNPDIIIFIDEIHNIVGAGGTSGSMDASNIIKPALSRGSIKCIGATTLEEYKKHIESESAFERRFQKVYIGEPTIKETETILNNIKQRYEDFHGVVYSDDIIKECVHLANKYITYRKFPDKAIDLMDEVGARVKLKNARTPPTLVDLELELNEATFNKKEASSNQKFEEAAILRDYERDLMSKIKKEREDWEKSVRESKVLVTPEDVASIISFHTNIPVKKITGLENKMYLNISNVLKEKIIGQDEAVEKVADAIQRARMGFNDPLRPLASFLFLGPTGVGKTLMAKLLSSHLFSAKDSFIRIDMSEYEDKFSISKLIGSPPGYIGHEDKGQLTEKVKNRPYSLILFDEIEKAHPDVFNVFLQVLDEGTLTDSVGTEVNFKNTIIVMTSNIGTRNILEENRLGFENNSEVLKDDKKMVFKELEKHFKPEFINRIDEKVVFNPLGKPQIKDIAKIELNEILGRIKEGGFDITASDDVVKKIAEEGYDKKYGARPIKRAISEKIGNLVSKAVLNGEVLPLKQYTLDVVDNVVVIKEIQTKKKNVRGKSK